MGPRASAVTVCADLLSPCSGTMDGPFDFDSRTWSAELTVVMSFLFIISLVFYPTFHEAKYENQFKI